MKILHRNIVNSRMRKSRIQDLYGLCFQKKTKLFSNNMEESYEIVMNNNIQTKPTKICSLTCLNISPTKLMMENHSNSRKISDPINLFPQGNIIIFDNYGIQINARFE